MLARHRHDNFLSLTALYQALRHQNSFAPYGIQSCIVTCRDTVLHCCTTLPWVLPGHHLPLSYPHPTGLTVLHLLQGHSVQLPRGREGTGKAQRRCYRSAPRRKKTCERVTHRPNSAQPDRLDKQSISPRAQVQHDEGGREDHLAQRADHLVLDHQPLQPRGQGGALQRAAVDRSQPRGPLHARLEGA